MPRPINSGKMTPPKSNGSTISLVERGNVRGTSARTSEVKDRENNIDAGDSSGNARGK